MVSERTVKVRVTGDISDLNRAFLAGSAGAKAFVRDLDTSSDRMSNLVQTSLALAPALVPIGAAIVPAISGLTSSLALAAGGAGVAILAFQGIGDALKATNDYAIDPSAANFDKMQQSLSELGPAGREFVGFLQEIRPELQGLQDAAQAGLLPGAEQGIRELMEVMPQAERVIGTFGTTVGTLLAEAGDNLNDPRWVEFFDYIEGEAKTTLLDFGRAIGNLGEGFANLWMAFDPLSDDFSSSFLQMSRDFASWSDGLAETQGFQEFVDYIQDNGPQAWETLGALGGALLEFVEAAAPVGAVALPVIEALADAFSAIADTPVGPALIGAAAAISAVSRAIALVNVAQGGALASLFGKTALGGAARATKDLPAASRAYLDFGAALDTAGPKVGKFSSTSARLGASLRGLGKIGVPTAALGLMVTGLDEKMGLTNTATLALAGSLAGPFGAAVGGGVGLAMDLADSTTSVSEAMTALSGKIDSGTLSIEQQKKALAEAQEAYAALEATGLTSDDDLAALQALEQQVAKNARAADDAKLAEAGFGSSMDNASASARAQALALADAVAQHNKLADAALQNATGMIGLEQAMDDARAAAEENGATLDINTQAGRDNKSALIDLASSWNDLTPAQQNATGEAERVRAKFIEVATQMGKNTAEAHLMADQYLDVPTDITTDANLRDNASEKLGRIAGRIVSLDRSSATPRANLSDGASAGIGVVAGSLARLDGNTATVYIRTVGAAAAAGAIGAAAARAALGKADGGIVDYFANGGLRENHIAQIAPAGTWRVWAEDETGGESYIPLAPSKRARSLDIWAETGKRLGVQGFADGALAGASRVAASIGAGGSATLSPANMSVSLVGTQVAIDPRTNIGTFVRGEVRLAIGEQARTSSDEFRRADRGGRYARS